MTPRRPARRLSRRLVRAFCRSLACAAVTVVSAADGARAALTQAEIASVGITQKTGARIPGDARFRDASGRDAPLRAHMAGRPSVLVFADYQCRTVCGAALGIFAGALSEMPSDARFGAVVVGLDPRDTPRIAARTRARFFGAAARAPAFLVGDEAAIRELAERTGYRYAFDAERDEYAHPVAAIVTDSSGRVVRYLSMLGMSARDLTLALNDAGAPPKDLAQALRMLCYRYDPVLGAYTNSIRTILQIGGALTVAGLIGGFVFLTRQSRRRGGKAGGAARHG